MKPQTESKGKRLAPSAEKQSFYMKPIHHPRFGWPGFLMVAIILAFFCSFRVQAGAPPAPTGVKASDGIYTDKIRVTWSAVLQANGYVVWRNTTTNLQGATRIGSAAGTVFEDIQVVPGRVYWYSVRATNAEGVSAFSIPNSGYMAVLQAPTYYVSSIDDSRSQPIIVKSVAVAGATTYEIWRNPDATTAGAVKLGITAATSYEDRDSASHFVLTQTVMGDLDGDGKISVKDATIMLRIAVGLVTCTAEQFLAGDVSKDGELDMRDVTLILRAVAGLTSLSPTAGGPVNPNSTTRIQITGVRLQPEEVKEVSLVVEASAMNGLGFTLEWDPSMARFQELTANGLNNSIWVVNSNQMAQGRLGIVAVVANSAALTNAEVARIKFIGASTLTASTAVVFQFSDSVTPRAATGTDAWISASFTSNPGGAEERYSLAWYANPPGSGSVVLSPNRDPNDGKYASGTTITLTAVPAAGSVFSSWGGDASGSGNPTTITMNTNKSVTANFAPQGQPGTLQFSQSSWSTNENVGSATITVTRTGGSAEAVGVSYATSNGSATAGSDYAATSGTLSWASGDMTAKTFQVPILNDTLVEGTETVNLTLSNPTSGATLGSPSTATLSILDDDQAVSRWTLTLNAAVGGTVTANPLPGGDGKYDAGTVLALTATPASDYKFLGWEGALSGTANPAKLTVNGNVSVTAAFETVLPAVVLVNPSFEADTFTKIPGYVGDNGPITGWSADGAGVNPIWPFATTNYYFTDNGVIPDGRQAAFLQSDGALSQVVKGLVMGGTYRVDYCENGRLWYEGAANSEPIVEVRMGGAVIVPAHPVPAVGGSNPYTAKQSATFVATATQMELAFVKVGPLGLDRTVLIDDVRVVYLTPPTAVDSYTLTVNVQPTGGGTVEAVPSSASGQYAAGTGVQLTAKASDGYVFSSWSGDVSGTVNPSTVTMNANKSVTASFVPLGLPGTLQFLQLNWYETEGAGFATITVTRTGGSSGAVDVSYATSNGSAIAGQDYTAASGTLQWAAGETAPKTFQVPILDDTLLEPPETVLLVLSNPTGNAIAGGAATLTIDSQIAAESWTLVLASSPSAGGTIAASLGPGADGKYASGTVVTLTATPNAGYIFTGWSGDASGSANPTTVTMNGNKSVTANFTPKAADVTQPGDTIVATSNNSPFNEGVSGAIDNVIDIKYLNFDKLNTGFTVTPGVGVTVVTGLGLTSANDSPERDPASYRLEGSHDGQAFTLIAEGSVGAFANRFEEQDLWFSNTTAYRHYRLLFPTIVDANLANSMQVGEVQLFGAVAAVYSVTSVVSPAGSGSVSVSPPPGTDGYYLNGAVLTLTATPVSGYKFSRWEGALSGTTSPATLTINGNLAVTAKFETVLPAVVLVNPSFEADTFTKIPGYVGDNGPITGWSADGAGVNPIWPFASTNYYFTDNGAIPDGRQAAFVQSDGALSQVVKGLAMGGTYRVDFSENGRSHEESGDPILEVRMGGTVIVPAHGVSSVGGSNPYTAKQSATFVATASQMELAFVKVGPSDLDRTVLIDDVRVLCLAMPLRLSVSSGKGNLNLVWDPALSGFILESTTSLTPPVQWTPVSGVINNQVTLPTQGTTRFYRLRY
jgi:uncharacterized repeat protein (TIGR02543 family)